MNKQSEISAGIKLLDGNIRRLHFVGIGGISMSSLAAISRRHGYEVSGSDRNASGITQKLQNEGIQIFIGHNAENIGGAQVIIYTAAMADDNCELVAAREQGIPCIPRAVYLGYIMKSYQKRIGVAGTHGKSTTTSMIAEIFMRGLNPTVVSGAQTESMGGAYRIGGKEYFIFEACEYMDSFLSFYPTSAVINNIELDHIDYFHSIDQMKQSFFNFANIADMAFVNWDDRNCRDVMLHYPKPFLTYGIDNRFAYYKAANIAYEGGFARFDLMEKNDLVCRIELSAPGRHNIYNALAAAAASLQNGASPDMVSAGLKQFQGAKRRFEFKGKLNGAFLFDDYAHHPSAIRATLAAAKSNANGRIICVYQPHTHSRTAELFEDFKTAFADADIVVLADIYANLEHDDAAYQVSSAMLANAIINTKAVYMPNFSDIADFLRKNAKQDDIVFTMGAGDIYKVGNILLQFTVVDGTVK